MVAKRTVSNLMALRSSMCNRKVTMGLSALVSRTPGLISFVYDEYHYLFETCVTSSLKPWKEDDKRLPYCSVEINQMIAFAQFYSLLLCWGTQF